MVGTAHQVSPLDMKAGYWQRTILPQADKPGGQCPPYKNQHKTKSCCECPPAKRAQSDRSGANNLRHPTVEELARQVVDGTGQGRFWIAITGHDPGGGPSGVAAVRHRHPHAGP